MLSFEAARAKVAEICGAKANPPKPKSSIWQFCALGNILVARHAEVLSSRKSGLKIEAR